MFRLACLINYKVDRIPLIVDQTATDHATEPKTTDVIGKIMTDLKSTNFAGYSLTNVHIQTDILTPAPALVAKIDAFSRRKYRYTNGN